MWFSHRQAVETTLSGACMTSKKARTARKMPASSAF
jgi:hypothetical protein